MSSAPTLRELIEDDRIHVLDGAMGTLLYDRGVFVNVCYDALVLEQPDLVRRIHAEYVAAGAEIIETNTFGANPVKLSSYGMESRTGEINRVAAILAREAAEASPVGASHGGASPTGASRSGGSRAGVRALVVGAIGPLGIRIEPWGPTARDEAEGHFRRQVEGLLEGGVDGFILETFSDVAEIQAAFRAVRSLSDLPVIAQMTVGEAGATSYGTSAEVVARELTEMGADVIGLNCAVGPAAILDAIEEMAPRTTRPLSAQPNAGLPRTVRDRKIYMASPEYMARYARRLIDSGVRFIGGCCGTTPEHIKRISETVRSVQPRHPAVRVRAPEPAEGEPAGAVQGVAGGVGGEAGDAPEGGAGPAVETVPLERRSVFGAALARGDFMATLELLPPSGWDPTAFLERARRARDAGVHAVTVVDNPRGGSRMSALAAGLLVQQQTGIETVVHYTCRDRNMMGMISDLLGAAAGGIHNVLLVSGDPPVQGPYADSTVVFDIDSIGLTNVVHGLNRGRDPGGTSIGTPTRFVVAVAANPGAVDMEREVDRFMWKAEAGADVAITLPVFDPAALERFLERTRRWPLAVMAGVWPLRSLREAEFLANEVPGVVVPDPVVERMRRAQARSDEHAGAEGIAIAREMLEAVKPLVRGVHVSVPGSHIEAGLAVLEGHAPGGRP